MKNMSLVVVFSVQIFGDVFVVFVPKIEAECTYAFMRDLCLLIPHKLLLISANISGQTVPAAEHYDRDL